jgi:hypothetical protein
MAEQVGCVVPCFTFLTEFGRLACLQKTHSMTSLVEQKENQLIIRTYLLQQAEADENFM